MTPLGETDPCSPIEFDDRLNRLRRRRGVDAGRQAVGEVEKVDLRPGSQNVQVTGMLDKIRILLESEKLPGQQIRSSDVWQYLLRNFGDLPFGINQMEGTIQPVLDIAPNAVCQRCSIGGLLVTSNNVTVVLFDPQAAAPPVEGFAQKEFAVEEIEIGCMPTVGGVSCGFRIEVRRRDAPLGQNLYTLATVGCATKDGANPIITNHSIVFKKPIYLTSEYAVTATTFNVLLGAAPDTMEANFTLHLSEWVINTMPGRAQELCVLPVEAP